MGLLIHDIEHYSEQGQLLLCHMLVDLLTDLIVAVPLEYGVQVADQRGDPKSSWMSILRKTILLVVTA